MLLVYLRQLEIAQQQLLISWDSAVRYWPRSWAHADVYNSAIPLDWWLLFSNPSLASFWLLRYPDDTRIIMGLDE